MEFEISTFFVNIFINRSKFKKMKKTLPDNFILFLKINESHFSNKTKFLLCCPRKTRWLGGHHFLWNGGVMNFRKYLSNIFVTPPFDDQKFYDPLRSYNVEETCNPPMRVAQKICIFGAILLNKIFIKICSHPKIS